MDKRKKRWPWLLVIGIAIAGGFYLNKSSSSQHIRLIFIGYVTDPGEDIHVPRTRWMLTNSGSAFVTGFILGSQSDMGPRKPFLTSFPNAEIIEPKIFAHLKPGEGKVFKVAQPDDVVMRWRINYLYQEQTLKNKLYSYIGIHSKMFPLSLFPSFQHLFPLASVESEWVEKKPAVK